MRNAANIIGANGGFYLGANGPVHYFRSTTSALRLRLCARFATPASAFASSPMAPTPQRMRSNMRPLYTETAPLWIEEPTHTSEDDTTVGEYPEWLKDCGDILFPDQAD